MVGLDHLIKSCRAFFFRNAERFKCLLENVVLCLLEHLLRIDDVSLVFFPVFNLEILASVFESDSFDLRSSFFAHFVSKGEEL